MSNMTIHSDRSPFAEHKDQQQTPHRDVLVNGDRKYEARADLLVNGDRKYDTPSLDSLTLSQSWNGFIWQVQQTPEGKLPNGHTRFLQTYPLSGNSREPPMPRRDTPLSKSRESLGSGDRLSTGDRLSNSSDRNRFTMSYDDDSLTTASSNLDSSEQEEEYVTLDRSYVFPRHFRHQPLAHHSSMIDLKHNSLYSPKMSNEQMAHQNNRTLPQQKRFKGPVRSISMTETNLDEVDVNGKHIPWAKRSLKKIYENIEDIVKSKNNNSRTSLPPFNPLLDDRLSIHSDYVGLRGDTCPSETGSLRTQESVDSSTPNSGNSKTQTQTQPARLRKRSKSLGELRLFNADNENELDLTESSDSSDVDGDEFGFLSHSSFSPSSPPTAMHKSKSPTAHHRILPKRWRSKPRTSTSGGTCLWSPEGNCSWCNVSGRRLVLRPISILQLSEVERHTLQKIILNKLQAIDLGCSVVIPKEHKETGRRKKHLLSIKRSKSANLSGLIHGLADKERDKDHQPAGLVFGLPLAKCIANDLELQRKRNSGPLKERKPSDVIIHRQAPRKSSSSSQGSVENFNQNGTSFSSNQKRNASSDSLSESESSRNTSSSLLDALSLSTNRGDNQQQQHDYLPSAYATGAPQVPHIVKVCFKHIETYGLRVLGIFRVGSSKKRTKQLRDEFDTGKDVKLNESHNPHEVGSVLKEYFRDLPEPLMTRDLYSPFIAARGLDCEEKRLDVMRMLISLLPVPNRDTLWSLLQFLYTVTAHSTDVMDENGQTLPGNKMDSNNLATIFGPNLLHKAKSTDKEFTVESMERAGERKEVIEVVKGMLDNHQALFTIPAHLHDETLQMLLESDPETTEQIIKRLSNDGCVDGDADTSGSMFEDSDASLPHSPTSVSNLTFRSNDPICAHPPLRVAKSAEILTPVSRRKFFYSLTDDGRPGTDHRNSRFEQPEETQSQITDPRPKFHLVIENSPSPPEVNRTTPRMSRPNRGLPREHSSPDLTGRPRSMIFERPQSEIYSTPQTLSIPAASYMRRNSGSKSPSQSNTSLNSPVRGDSFVRGGSLHRSGSNSPRVTSSIQRPLNFHTATPEGENEWQKDRWRHWDTISAEKPADGFEQETLV